MKLEATLCQSHLLSMLLMPEDFSKAVTRYEASTPDMNGEGFNGFMEVKATFYIKDLSSFSDLWSEAYVFPSDRSKWYHQVKSQTLGKL